MKQALRIVLLLSIAAVVILSVRYTYEVQRTTGMGDLRSRVVAARMMSDGRSPYFYNWFPGDSLRYYDGAYVDSPRVNSSIPANMTASPAFLRLIQPFANFDQQVFDWGFYILFHCCFLIVFCLALRYTREAYKWYVPLLFIPFLWTDGWIYHFYVVQQYMLYGFLFSIVVLLLTHKKAVAAGLVVALLFLLRPNTSVFIIPFVLLWQKANRAFVFTTAVSIFAYATFAFLSPMENKLWSDFFTALKWHQALHMQPGETVYAGNRIHTIPLLPQPFEGVDYQQLDSIWQAKNFVIDKESTNFKEGYEAVFKTYPSVWALQLLFLISAGAFILWGWWRSVKKEQVPLHKLLIMGLMFYFLTNLFSSVAIVPYHLPQWYAVALAYCIYAHRLPKVVLYLFVVGVLINFHFVPIFHGRHLLGEIVLLSSAALAIVLPEKRSDNILQNKTA